MEHVNSEKEKSYKNNNNVVSLQNFFSFFFEFFILGDDQWSKLVKR